MHYLKKADPEKKLLRLYVSSYASSLGALIRARRSPAQPTSLTPRLLVVSQPNTPGEMSLGVEDEINYVSQKVPGATLLEGQGGTRDAVIEEIPNHTWAHFSCHAYSVDENPLRSYFSLHDSRLEVLDVLRTPTPTAELAVLTACHSAGPNTTAPDEFLHLAGATEFAGFRSVIVSSWEIDDEDGSFCVKEFYHRLLEMSKELEEEGEEVPAYTCAAKALHETVLTLRSERKVPPWRWVNYVHYGA